MPTIACAVRLTCGFANGECERVPHGAVMLTVWWLRFFERAEVA